MFTWFQTAKDTFTYGFTGLWTIIDGIFYKIVSLFFRLFYALADFQLLDNSVYEAISTRVYLFVGIVALFILSVSLLKALVNPDELNKGVIKSFKSLVTSVLLIILMPTIFKYVFSLQGAILSDDLIGKIFQFNISDKAKAPEDSDNSMKKMCTFKKGQQFNIKVGTADGKYKSSNDITITEQQCRGNYITLTVLKSFFTPVSNDVENLYNTTWSEAEKYMVYTGNFNYISTFAKNAHEEEENQTITYLMIVSTVAAVILMYLLLSFSIDLGVRSAKLAFYQLISPIPVLMRMIPGKEGQYDKWSKSVISTYLELFIRILIINFVIFMCSNLFDLVDAMKDGFGNVGLIAKGIIVMGLFAFGKQAPKLLAEALGFEGGNLRLGFKGFKEKLSDGGAFAAGAAAGGLATAGTRNLYANAKGAINDLKTGNLKGGLMKAIKTPISGFAGAASGMVRGAKEGLGAKDFTGVKNAAGKAAADAVGKREKREAYRATHNGPIILNKAKDLGTNVKAWATGSAAGAVDKVNYAQNIKDLYGEFESMFSTPAYNQKKEQLKDFKTPGAAKKYGMSDIELKNAIKELEGSMLHDRIKAFSTNTSNYAYSLKQIADAAKKSPELMASIGIDQNVINKMSNYKVSGDKVVDRLGNEITAQDLISMYEGTAYQNVSYDKNIDSIKQNGNIIDDLQLGSIQSINDGFVNQKKKATDAVNIGKTSISYKEAMKKQNEKK